MATTRTGSIPIGMRCNSAWMSDPDEVIPFAIKYDFACVDTGAWEPKKIKTATDQGLSIGTVDLPQPWENLASSDPAILRSCDPAILRSCDPAILRSAMTR